MRGFSISALIAVLFAGTVGTMNAAQPGALGTEGVFNGDGGRSTQWQGSGLPYGDYQQTCRNIHNDGRRLDATCQKRDGNWRNTSLNYRSCQGAIVNDDGRLRCSSSGNYSDRWHGGVPPGTYQQTCRNIRIDGDRLTATCQKRNGDWRDTSLKNFAYCRIENDNGRLRCQ
ncbi:MAG TPA: CVNH domain-containing protein [Candidatus Angelobacter sp.]|nr:CVNH domain-containing protein [Candidatus Angelobacter sp.]